MNSTLYITEPKSIDIGVVGQVLDKNGIKYFSGTIDFVGSKDKKYDALLIRSATKIDSNIKDHFPELRSIIRAGVGLDNVDLDYCKKAGIAVYNAPGANADAVSEYVVAVILYVLRGLNKLTMERVVDWDRFAFRGSSIREHAIGIVGFGNIGRLLYEKLNAFSSPEFYVYDPYVKADSINAANVHLASLEEVLKCCTIISLHLPLTPETLYIIDKQKLKLLQNDTLLINASRGGIVDEDAMVACLKAGQQLTYVADTVEDEPVVNSNLLDSENIILTPHIGSLTSFSEKQMVRLALENYLNNIQAKVFS